MDLRKRFEGLPDATLADVARAAINILRQRAAFDKAVRIGLHRGANGFFVTETGQVIDAVISKSNKKTVSMKMVDELGRVETTEHNIWPLFFTVREATQEGQVETQNTKTDPKQDRPQTAGEEW